MKQDRKDKEMQIKAFQDKQLEEKMAIKEAAKNKKNEDYQKVIQDKLSFDDEERRKREYIRDKNLENLVQVKRQMNEEPRMFAKTGIAILRS